MITAYADPVRMMEQGAPSIIRTDEELYERRSKNRPQSAACAAVCGGAKGIHRRRLVLRELP